MRIHLRYGREGLEVEVNLAHVVHHNPLPPLTDPQATAYEACAEPLGTPPLPEVIRGRSSACIAISDITRPVPNAILLAPILRALEDEGIAAGDILILIATGLHRPSTDDELQEMLGHEILSGGYRIESHIARDPDSHVEVGVTSRGSRALIDRRWVEAELRIIVSLVEPHLMAGYSGGRKQVCPGLAATETIMSFHSPQIIEPAESSVGNLGNNPVDREALEVALLAGGVDFTINCTLDEQRNITGIFAGGLREAQLTGMAHAERQAKAIIDRPVDICVTTNAGYPLDLTFYQGIKGIWSAMNIVRERGTIIVAHECAEGIGGPEFTELMLTTEDPHEFMRRAFAGEVSCVDQWALHLLEKPLRSRRIMNYSTGIPFETQKQLFVEPIPSVEAGIATALAEYGSDATIAVIPEGPYVIACLAGSRLGRLNVREMMAEAEPS